MNNSTRTKKGQPRMPDNSLWVWGRLRDLEREGYLDKPAKELLQGMTEGMREDVARIAPLASTFFRRLSDRAAK